MALLKEDGSLDIERINKRPLEEYMEEIGGLNKEQRTEYWNKMSINKSRGRVQTILVDYTLEDDLNRGAVIAVDFINKMRQKYEYK